jgi:hypothetical protein
LESGDALAAAGGGSKVAQAVEAEAAKAMSVDAE